MHVRVRGLQPRQAELSHPGYASDGPEEVDPLCSNRQVAEGARTGRKFVQLCTSSERLACPVSI